MVEVIARHYRCGIPWRDLPKVDGPWQTVWTWCRHTVEEGTWDPMLTMLTPHRLPMAWGTGRSRWTPRSPPTSVRHEHQATPRGLC